MKKLLLLITLTITLVLGGCVAPSQDTELEELEKRVEELEATVEAQEFRLNDLEDLYSNVITTTGLNGQTDYYVNYNGNQYLSRMSYMAVDKTEKDYLDKTNFPDYIWGLDGEYIDINELGNLLSQKYFGVSSVTTTGFQYRMRVVKPAEMSNEEYMVRLCMMIIEISNFDYYIIDASQLYLEFIEGSSQYMLARMSLLVSDSYNLHPAIFWSKLMDTQIIGFYYNELELDAIYQQFITDGTFDGYVLPNYK